MRYEAATEKEDLSNATEAEEALSKLPPKYPEQKDPKRKPLVTMYDRRARERVAFDADDEDDVSEDDEDELLAVDSKGLSSAGMRLRDADGKVRVEAITPPPYLDKQALRALDEMQASGGRRLGEKALEPSEADKERSMARPMRRKPLVAVLDDEGTTRVSIDAQPEYKYNETESESDEEVVAGLSVDEAADADAGAAEGSAAYARSLKYRKWLHKYKRKLRSGITIADGHGRERTVIETTDEPDRSNTTEVEEEAAELADEGAAQKPKPPPKPPPKPSITRPPPCDRCFDGKPKPKPLQKALMQFKDKRGVQRVAVDASDDDEEADTEKAGRRLGEAKGAKPSTSTRGSGVVLRDMYGKTRVDLKTESDANVTTGEVVAQLSAEAEAEAVGEKPPPRKPPKLSKPKPLLSFFDEKSAERVSIDATAEKAEESSETSKGDGSEEVASAGKRKRSCGMRLKDGRGVERIRMSAGDDDDDDDDEVVGKDEKGDGRRLKQTGSKKPSKIALLRLKDDRGVTRATLDALVGENETAIEEEEAAEAAEDPSSAAKKPRRANGLTLTDAQGTKRLEMATEKEDLSNATVAEEALSKLPPKYPEQKDPKRKPLLVVCDRNGGDRVAIDADDDDDVTALVVLDKEQRPRSTLGADSGLALLDSQGTPRMVASTSDENYTSLSLLDGNGFERSRLSAAGELKTFDEEGLDRFAVDQNGDLLINDGEVEAFSISRFGILGFDADGNTTLSFDRLDGNLDISGEQKTEEKGLKPDSLQLKYAEFCQSATYSTTAAMRACETKDTQKVMEKLGVQPPTERTAKSETQTFKPVTGKEEEPKESPASDAKAPDSGNGNGNQEDDNQENDNGQGNDQGDGQENGDSKPDAGAANPKG